MSESVERQECSVGPASEGASRDRYLQPQERYSSQYKRRAPQEMSGLGSRNRWARTFARLVLYALHWRRTREFENELSLDGRPRSERQATERTSAREVRRARGRGEALCGCREGGRAETPKEWRPPCPSRPRRHPSTLSAHGTPRPSCPGHALPAVASWDPSILGNYTSRYIAILMYRFC